MPKEKRGDQLITKEFRTVNQIRGPLLFVERVADVAYDEMVEVIDPTGRVRVGRVLEVDNDVAVIQLFLSTEGLDISRTKVRFTGDVIRLNVSHSMLGRILDGLGNPIDGGPKHPAGKTGRHQWHADQPGGAH